MTRDEADVLEVDSERLSSDVNNAELDLETYEQTAAEDQRLADEVRTMLGGGGGGVMTFQQLRDFTSCCKSMC